MTSNEINKFAKYMVENSIFSIAKDHVELILINNVITVRAREPNTVYHIKVRRGTNGPKEPTRRRLRTQRSPKNKAGKSKAKKTNKPAKKAIVKNRHR